MEKEQKANAIPASELGDEGPTLSRRKNKDGTVSLILNAPSIDSTLSSAVNIIIDFQEE